MKTSETKEIIQKVETNIQFWCDWCKKEIPDPRYTHNYEVNDFELSWRTGESYPECGSGEIKKVELCDDCKEKLFNWLKENGCEIQEGEWEN
jgi:hypothetical protein